MVEKEQFEKKRLSMENEELMWRMRQGSQEILSCSSIEVGGCQPASSSTPFSSSFSEFSYEHQQMHQRHHNPCQPAVAVGSGQLSCSFTEGCPKSLPPFMGKKDDGPRVLEVVEKTESVAWKIEYDEQMRQQMAAAAMSGSYHAGSPMLKRKLSPLSPGMGRRVAARSMENMTAGAVASPAASRRLKMTAPPTVFEKEECDEIKCRKSDKDEAESVSSSISSDVNSTKSEEINVAAGEMAAEAEDDIDNEVIVSTPEPVDISSCGDGQPVDIDAADISSSSEIEIFDADVDDVDDEESGFVSKTATVEGPCSPTTTADEVTLADTASPTENANEQEQPEELEEACSSLESSLTAEEATATIKDDDDSTTSSLEEPQKVAQQDTSKLSAREMAELNRRRAMSSSFHGGATGLFSVAAASNANQEEEDEDNSLSVASCSDDF